MFEHLSPLAADVLSFLATYVVHSTCLLAAVSVYFCCHRGASPALRSRLWKFGATAGFLTAPLSLYWSPLTFPTDFAMAPPTSAPVTSVATAEEISFDREFAEEAFLPSPEIFSTDEVAEPLQLPLEEIMMTAEEIVVPVDPIAAEEWREVEPFVEVATEIAATVPTPILPFTQSGNRLVIILIAAGFCLLLGMARLLSQSFWVRRRFANCRPVHDGPAARELNKLLKQQRLTPKIRLLASPDYPEPVAFGLFRWHIVLPDRAAAELSREELRGLLAHELAHLVRRDLWWLFIGRLLCTAFAYQPLNF